MSNEYTKFVERKPEVAKVVKNLNEGLKSKVVKKMLENPLKATNPEEGYEDTHTFTAGVMQDKSANMDSVLKSIPRSIIEGALKANLSDFQEVEIKAVMGKVLDSNKDFLEADPRDIERWSELIENYASCNEGEFPRVSESESYPRTVRIPKPCNKSLSEVMKSYFENYSIPTLEKEKFAHHMVKFESKVKDYMEGVGLHNQASSVAKAYLESIGIEVELNASFEEAHKEAYSATHGDNMKQEIAELDHLLLKKPLDKLAIDVEGQTNE